VIGAAASVDDCGRRRSVFDRGRCGIVICSLLRRETLIDIPLVCSLLPFLPGAPPPFAVSPFVEFLDAGLERLRGVRRRGDSAQISSFYLGQYIFFVCPSSFLCCFFSSFGSRFLPRRKKWISAQQSTNPLYHTSKAPP